MKTKVLITVVGGVVQSVESTEEIQYLVIDYDNIRTGEETERISPDEFYESDRIISDDELCFLINEANETLDRNQ